jgi:outer membrane protein OmpA-like peptidoglycan-associated protein
MLDDDEGARMGLWVTIGVVIFLLFGLLGALMLRSIRAGDAAAVAAASGMNSAAQAPAAEPEPVRAPPAPLEDLVVPTRGKPLAVVYFALGRAEVSPASAAAIDQAASAVRRGGRLLLTGYHDTAGDPARNAELAKARARAVREALVQAGAKRSRVLLHKPASADSGTSREARRVEIRMMVP